MDSSSKQIKQPEGLIRVLLDSGAEFGDRQDAAMDLASFDEEAVELALTSVACDRAADDDLADSCGESLAEIWCRRSSINRQALVYFVPASLRAALATLRACSTTLAEEAEAIVRAPN